MPISIVSNTVKDGMRALEGDLVEALRNGASAVAIESTKQIRARQASNEFWDNQSGNAIDSISGEISEESNIITVAAGFEDGRPNERDAPEYYGGRDREYAKYIGDRDGMSFVAAIQQTLIDNLVNMFNSIGVNMEFKSSRKKRK